MCKEGWWGVEEVISIELPVGQTVYKQSKHSWLVHYQIKPVDFQRQFELLLGANTQPCRGVQRDGIRCSLLSHLQSRLGGEVFTKLG